MMGGMARAKQKWSVLPRSFYESSPEVVARGLLGEILMKDREGERLSGRIVEAEAYLRFITMCCLGRRGTPAFI
jgi:DNA-3-methyladenine glycosylase